MRKKHEILMNKSLGLIYADNKDIMKNQNLMLEVLLDIRELLIEIKSKSINI